MLVAVGGEGPAANFCGWVQRLGAPARLVFPPDDSPTARRLVEELRAGGMDVCVPSARLDLCLAGARLLHLQAQALLASQPDTSPQRGDPDTSPRSGEGGAKRRMGRPGEANLARDAMTSVRKQKALVSIDLGEADWIRAQGAPRVAYQLAKIRPDILFASESSARELGAPLEGMAAVPVLTFPSQGCVVYGRRIAAPEGKTLDGDALAAAFCVAFLEGAAPVEAAGRAILVASGPLPPSGGGSG